MVFDKEFKRLKTDSFYAFYLDCDTIVFNSKENGSSILNIKTLDLERVNRYTATVNAIVTKAVSMGETVDYIEIEKFIINNSKEVS